jgi:hypothetical protein
MFNATMIRQHNCAAKQAGLMPTVWFTINSLSYDRGTSEGCQGSEGSGYA